MKNKHRPLATVAIYIVDKKEIFGQYVVDSAGVDLFLIQVIHCLKTSRWQVSMRKIRFQPAEVLVEIRQQHFLRVVFPGQ